jgi:hypothetical protein
MIFLCCLLTVLIEGTFLALLGYRDRSALIIIVCANVITNLLLNLTIMLAFSGNPGALIYLMEGLVVLAEYAVYAAAFGRGLKLFLTTLAANCISYGLGLLIF